MGIPFITMDAHNIVNDNVAQGCGYKHIGDIVETSVEGSVVTFNTNVVMPLISLMAQIDRTEEGVNSVEIYHTGKNLLSGEAAKDFALASFSASSSGENDTGKYYTLSAGYPINEVNMFPWLKFKNNTQYTFIVKLAKNQTSNSTNLRFIYTDNTYDNISRTSQSSVITEAEDLVITSRSGKTLAGIFGTYASGTSYIYYEHMGVFEGVVTADDYENYNGTVTTIQLNQTVHEGSLNVTTGELIADGTAVQLSPTEINTILGLNNISANTGDVALTYIRVNK